MPDFIDELLFHRPEWDALMAAELGPYITEGLTNGGRLGAATAERLGIVGTFDVENPEVQRWLNSYTMKFAQRINATAADRYREIISEGLRGGETLRDIRKRILDDPVVGPTADKYRAEMIARTETARAQNAGQEQAWVNANVEAREAGVDVPFIGKVWRTNPDACDYCASMDGKLVELTANYHELGSTMELEGVGSMAFGYEAVGYPPLHPNCRCYVDTEINPAYGG